MTFQIYAISAELKTLMNNEYPLDEPVRDFVRNEEIKISGKSAGMCYCEDNFDKILANDEAAKNRFKRVVGTHHHSIAEHAHIEVVITGMSKILAMILNNMTVYCTSEKSGRYTTMTGRFDLEKQTYKAWYTRIKDSLMESDMVLAKGEDKERVADKLAKENARYVLDIFSPMVSMCYTCSLTQWTYLAQWMREKIPALRDQADFALSKDMGLSNYCVELASEFETLSDLIDNAGLYIPELENKKGRQIDTFLGNYREVFKTADDLDSRARPFVTPSVDVLEDIVVVRYHASFAALAQLQRHRTSKFTMSIFDHYGQVNERSPKNHPKTFFIPRVVNSVDWIDDLNMLLAEPDMTLPIATTIPFKMVTTFDDFKSIMMERCCGRAQYETFLCTNTIHEAIFRKSAMYREFCADYGLPQRGVTKCMMQKCAEPCRYIARGLQNRNT